MTSAGIPNRSPARDREPSCLRQKSTPRAMRFSVRNIFRYSCHGFLSAGRCIASSTESSTLASASRARVSRSDTPCRNTIPATNGSISDSRSSVAENAGEPDRLRDSTRPAGDSHAGISNLAPERLESPGSPPPSRTAEPSPAAVPLGHRIVSDMFRLTLTGKVSAPAASDGYGWTSRYRTQP